jgi:ABC-type phosphate transport system substrate-binding protein
MRKTLALLFFITLLLAVVRPLASQNTGIVVIVNNATIPVESLTRDQVSKFFLKKVERWETGTLVSPVDLAAGSEVRDVFSRAIFLKSTTAIKSYWQNQIFSGRGVPPPERDSEAQVVDFVRSTPGAIGYVAASTPLANGVRAIRIVRR